jgi:hypothetical protein
MMDGRVIPDHNQWLGVLFPQLRLLSRQLKRAWTNSRAPRWGPPAPPFSTWPVAPGRGRWGPPLCSKANPLGPFWRNSSSQSPIVCASRSKVSATLVADHLLVKSRMACNRSISRGVSALHIRSRTAFVSNFQHSNISGISFIAVPRSGVVFLSLSYPPAAGFTMRSV